MGALRGVSGSVRGSREVSGVCWVMYSARLDALVYLTDLYPPLMSLYLFCSLIFSHDYF